MGFIGRPQLAELARALGSSAYGQYLADLASEEHAPARSRRSRSRT